MSHAELDRYRRLYEEEELAFRWVKLRHERDAFYREIASDRAGANVLLSLSTTTPSEPSDASARVCVYWQGEKRYYPGVVIDRSTRDDGTPTFHVRYDDGDLAWESDVEDPLDPTLPICRRHSTCWKRKGHPGPCLGTKRVKNSVGRDAASDAPRDDPVVTVAKRVRQRPTRLTDTDWGTGQSRSWHS